MVRSKAMSIEFFMSLGYVGLFLLALVSNAIPYSTIPYLIFVAPLLSKLRGTSLLLAILVLAGGATAGKVVVYAIGRSVSKIKAIDNFMSGLIAFAQRHEKSIFIVVFMVAALPLPDDVFYIPIGTSRYNLVLFTIALFAGKLVITFLTAIYGIALGHILEGYVGLPPIVTIPLMITVTVALVIIMGKMDWKGVERTYLEKGVLPTLIFIAKSFLEILILKPLIKLKSLVCSSK